MGQAKRRGSKGDRVAQSIERSILAEEAKLQRRRELLAAERARFEALSPEEREREMREWRAQRNRRRSAVLAAGSVGGYF